jgi:hypothetical protein
MLKYPTEAYIKQFDSLVFDVKKSKSFIYSIRRKRWKTYL